jgi:hypothetical protein
MLDVHPPHAPTHTWKDFFIHIATIVVGLFIAVGLEQTVEYFHHEHQLHHFEEALRKESHENLDKTDSDVALLREVIRAEDTNRASLLAAMASGSHTPVRFVDLPLSASASGRVWLAPTDAVWSGARDGNLLPSIPEERATNLARLNIVVTSLLEIQHQLFDQEYRVRASATLRGDVDNLTPEEREILLDAIGQFQQIAAHAIYQLQRARTVIQSQ